MNTIQQNDGVTSDYRSNLDNNYATNNRKSSSKSSFEYRISDLRSELDTDSKDKLFNGDSNNNVINVTNIINTIFRYKFTEDFTNMLYEFAKIHEYDDRKSFKDAWDIWLQENNEIIISEITRLNELGYTGDIINKMFKSARYYYRKKGTEKKAQVCRRIYIGIHKDIIQLMDAHIKSTITIKPSQSFVEFCNIHATILQNEMTNLLEKGFKTQEETIDKIKKTYKNRHYLLSNKIICNK